MRKMSMASIAVIGMACFSNGYAATDFNCPSAAKAAMDAQFLSTVDGVPTSDLTQCLGVRSEIKVAVNVSGAAINAKNGINQQINNVKNMVENYESVYGLTQGNTGYQIAVIVHGSAGKFLLTPAVYDAKNPGDIGGNVATTNAVNFLLSKGVKVYMCQNTMRSNGYVTADITPGVKEVPSGVTAVADFGMRQWVVMTP